LDVYYREYGNKGLLLNKKGDNMSEPINYVKGYIRIGGFEKYFKCKMTKTNKITEKIIKNMFTDIGKQINLSWKKEFK
jgi:hypothetical protein